MGMTMTQKILARHAGLEHVVPGQLVEGKLDLVLGNDITSPVAIDEFDNAAAACQVFDKRQDRAGHGPLHPQQGYQGRPACAAQVREFAQVDVTSPISLTWAAWVWSTPRCPRQGLAAPGDWP
ncbi:MAG: hypothetical protein ACLRWQ_12435 [Flavonifractor plautii]